MRRFVSLIVVALAIHPAVAGAQATPVAAPEFSPETTTISYSRGGCLGMCPAYKIEIHGDGSVSFDGESYTVQKGTLDYKVDPGEVAGLYAFITARDFWSLDDAYKVEWTDQIFKEICVAVGARKKCVVDYSGENAGMPHSVKDIEDEINRVGRTDPLVQTP